MLLVLAFQAVLLFKVSNFCSCCCVATQISQWLFVSAVALAIFISFSILKLTTQNHDRAMFLSSSFRRALNCPMILCGCWDFQQSRSEIQLLQFLLTHFVLRLSLPVFKPATWDYDRKISLSPSFNCALDHPLILHGSGVIQPLRLLYDFWKCCCTCHSISLLMSNITTQECQRIISLSPSSRRALNHIMILCGSWAIQQSNLNIWLLHFSTRFVLVSPSFDVNCTRLWQSNEFIFFFLGARLITQWSCTCHVLFSY